MKPVHFTQKFFFVLLSFSFSLLVGAQQSIGDYNVYYGHLHNHTEFSDGTGTIDQAYDYAKNTAGLDFFGISDHANQIDATKWAATMAAADNHNIDNVFVTFWGFEWSHTTEGHVTIINTNDYTTRTAITTYSDLLSWIDQRECLAFLNHPGRQDGTGEEFSHFTATSNNKVVGMELWNKSDAFATYFYNDGYYTNDNNLGYFDEGLLRGWKLGAMGSEDNHDATWGTATDYRMAILSQSLTRTSLYEAMQQRRFYSTLDKNLGLSFKIDGNEMGSTIPGGIYEMQILSNDADGEIITKVELYLNGALTNSWTPNLSSVQITESVTVSDGDYLYVKVTQADNDEAISSPIFIEGGLTNELPVCTLLNPVNGTRFTSIQEIILSADASDDGSIENVEFFVNDISVGAVSGEPYNLNWTPAENGAYSIYAEAMDDLGSTSKSEVNAITVGDYIAEVSSSVSSSTDDAEEAESGVVYITSTDLELVYDSYLTAGNQKVGLRFLNPVIPQGATILNASIQFTVDEATSDATNLVIWGEKSANSASFSETTYDVSSRTKTMSSVSWEPNAWSTVGNAGLVQQTPDLSSIVQEVVDQQEYTMNSAFAFLIEGSGKRTAIAYDGDSQNAATLSIQYSTTVVNKPTDIMLSASEITENQPSGAVIGTLSAVDEDPDETFTFELIEGSGDNSEFIIDGVTLKSAAVFNYEETPELSIRIRVTDSEAYTFEKSFIISVLDVYEVPTYCDSWGDSNNEWIEQLSVGDRTVSSGNNGGYYDGTGQTVFGFETGELVSLTLSPGFSGRGTHEYWSVWIDYNSDGNFDDTELVFSPLKSKSAISGSFTVQNYTGLKRMRVSMSDSGSPVPCGSVLGGEVEDYSVNILTPGVNPPVALFTADNLSITAGDVVNFTDQSLNGPESWSWDFGDGTTSTLQNPLHTYLVEGVYTVSLYVSNSAGMDELIKTDFITVTAPATDPPLADFSVDKTSAYIGESLSFTDMSTNDPTSWSWVFGDGQTSTLQNPQVSYTAAGVYTITLTATNEYGSNTITVADYIEIFDIPISEYCEPSAIINLDDYIDNVMINSISSNTGQGTSGYVLYSEPDFGLSPGASYDITMNPYNAKNRNFWRIYLDVNGDGDFDDADETLFIGNNKKGTVSGSISIPSNTTTDTRLRISMKTGRSQAPCEDGFRGEVEDYIINHTVVQEKSGKMIQQEHIEVLNTVVEIYPNPVRDQLFLEFNTLNKDLKTTYKIYSMSGKLLETGTITNLITLINLEEHHSGMYFIEIKNPDINKVQKFIVE